MITFTPSSFHNSNALDVQSSCFRFSVTYIHYTFVFVSQSIYSQKDEILHCHPFQCNIQPMFFQRICNGNKEGAMRSVITVSIYFCLINNEKLIFLLHNRQKYSRVFALKVCTKKNRYSFFQSAMANKSLIQS